MKQSKLFTKTLKETPKDEVSINAKLLTMAGFIHKEIAGVYSYLPLGLKVLNNINNIIRDEMNKAGGQEIYMTVLQDKKIWEKTNRWDDEIVDNWFKTKLKNGNELGLGFTHEETITNIMKKYVKSYKDLPFYAYQIQSKFRNEIRAKSGVIRGREFIMKDLYSFSKDKNEHDKFFEKMKKVYMNVFSRMGLGKNTYLTLSSGESFSKYSYEFQTLCEAGEDTILIDKEKNIAINKNDYSKEILLEAGIKNEKKLIEKKSIEVGDIYTLKDKFSKALNLKYQDKNNKEKFVFMGSYGIGPTRLVGVIVETNNDKNGIIWPKEVAPFQVHLISLKRDNKHAEQIYYSLQKQGIDVLFDDRNEAAGYMLKDSDLIGIPIRLVVSDKLKEKVEYKIRSDKNIEIFTLNNVISNIKKFYKIL